MCLNATIFYNMANTLKIHKTGNNIFWHTHNNKEALNFAISDFDCSIDGNVFKIIEKDSAVRYSYLVENITIQVLNGSIESFSSAETLYQRLFLIGYTPFSSKSIIANLNVYNQKEIVPAIVSQTFIMPSGMQLISIFLNKAPLDLNDDYTVVGNTVTILTELVVNDQLVFKGLY